RSLVKLKFSDVPSWVEVRIEQAEHDQLKTWMRDTLFAEHLGDIFK
ncbi:hypothetical protein SAMN04487951_11960, partial [Vreelandella arcis]